MGSEFSAIVPEGAEVERLGNRISIYGRTGVGLKKRLSVVQRHPRKPHNQVDAGEGLSEYRFPSGKSNGMTMDKSGRLVVCEHANRRVSRTESDGSVVTIASHYKGKMLNSPNDVVVKSDGSVYFTDPPYGLNPTFGSFGQQELPFYGVYRLGPDGQELRLLIDDAVPNGLAFRPTNRCSTSRTPSGITCVFSMWTKTAVSPTAAFSPI